MNKKVLVAGLLVVVPLLVVFAVSFGRDPHAVQSPLVGRPAPPFALPTVGGVETIALTSLRGKPTIINFWATWCQPCRDEHRVLHHGAEVFGEEIRFLGVVYEDEEKTIRAFLEKHGSGYPALVDAGGKTAIAYGVSGVPETFFLDANGKVVAKHNGPLSWKALQHYANRLLEGA